MIRALSKNDIEFIYIYSVHEGKNYSENKVETYYLASCSTYQGLIVYRENEVYNIEPPRDCRRLNILREYDNENTKLHS